MKNRKKLVITLIGVIVLGIGLFVYQTFIKKQLHFKENLTVEINGKFNPNSYISEVEHGSVKDVACQSKNLNIKKLGKYEVTYTYKNREYTTTIQVVDTQKLFLWSTNKPSSLTALQCDLSIFLNLRWLDVKERALL